MKYITTEAELRELYPMPSGRALQKQQTKLDEPAKKFIRAAPFLCLATSRPDGSADCSPKGDPAGFVRIIDDKTLAIPDRKGNNRLDSLTNILREPKVGILFLIPGRNDTLRVNGHAKIVIDDSLLAELAVNGRPPTSAILVEVTEVFLHCPKAFIRSGLWKAGDQKTDLKEYIQDSYQQCGIDLSARELEEKTQEYRAALPEKLY